MKKLALAALTGMVLAGFTLPATAVRWFEPEPRIWKTVRALPGEDAWSACRRHFRYDTTRIAHGPPGIVYCYVPYHYLYGPGDRYQNFNQ